MKASQRFRRSVLDRLLADPEQDNEGVSLTYSLDQLRLSVARDVEALLNSRAALDFESLHDFPQSRKSVICFGIRDFVGLVLKNSNEQQMITASLKHAIASFEPRLRDVHIEVHDNPGSMGSLAFTIRALLLAHPAAEPVAFDALLQPALSRFSVAPSRFAPGPTK